MSVVARNEDHPDVAVSARSRPTVKFDLHGIVSVRLVDASAGDVSAVARQLGPIQTPDDLDSVDITIRFVNRIQCSSRLRYLGRHESGFTDDAYLILRSRHKAQTRTQIPMERVGGPCEILCEHGTPAVPLLLAIVNLTAASKGVLALHAAAFEWRGTGTVVTGWSKGGKTESLLAFMNRGARYIADEWCYIAEDGRQIFGVPEPVRLWHWQLAQLPHIRCRVPFGARLKMRALGLPSTFQRALPESLQMFSIGRTLQRIAHFAEQYRNVLMAPDRLFDQTVTRTAGSFDRLVFIMSGEDQKTTAEPISPRDVAKRMVHSLSFERQPLKQYYRMFKFAFPGAANPRLENVEATEESLLFKAFSDKPALRVEHPYPVAFNDLYDCLNEFVS